MVRQRQVGIEIERRAKRDVGAFRSRIASTVSVGISPSGVTPSEVPRRRVRILGDAFDKQITAIASSGVVEMCRANTVVAFALAGASRLNCR